MHNGVFRDLRQVIDFYDAGGGAGRGLQVDNQTLSSDSLRLSSSEKMKLIMFLRSLDEPVVFDKAPASLPASADKALNRRKVGGEY
jgi:cytochrome c peroxidase